jgi:hypothetical protein
MNAATSSDPEGRTLGYFWYLGSNPSFTNALATGACNASDGCIGAGVIEDYTLSASATGNQLFTLLVRDPGGLTATFDYNCNATGGTCTPA